MNLLRPIFLGVFCCNAISTYASECLEVVDYEINPPSSDYGIIELEWQAEVVNQCNIEFYASIRLTFLNSDGDSLRDSRTSLLIDSDGAITVNKKAILTEDQHEQVEHTTIFVQGTQL